MQVETDLHVCLVFERGRVIQLMLIVMTCDLVVQSLKLTAYVQMQPLGDRILVEPRENEQVISPVNN